MRPKLPGEAIEGTVSHALCKIMHLFLHIICLLQVAVQGEVLIGSVDTSACTCTSFTASTARSNMLIVTKERVQKGVLCRSHVVFRGGVPGHMSKNASHHIETTH
jgi:hypothetical protein